MHRSRALALVGVLAAAGSLALPFVTFPDQAGIGGIEASAWPVMLLLGPLAILMLSGDRREPPARPIVWIATTLAAAAVGFAVVKVIDAWTAAADVSGTVGPGAWSLAMAALVAGVGSILGFSRRI